LVQLRRVIELMDGGAESPQESRTRLVLVRSGLRKPATQTGVHDRFGYPSARIDTGWMEWKVGVDSAALASRRTHTPRRARSTRNTPAPMG
jgi:hypothetical protein